MPEVVTVTFNPAVDKSSSVDRVIPEDKLRCEAPTFQPGGGGLNVTRALSQLGVPSTAVWTCGGPEGALLSDLLDQEAVRHRPVAIQGWTRQNLTVFEHASTRQYRFGMPGPTLTPDEIDQVIAAVAALSCDVLVLSGSLPPGAPADTYRRLATHAPEDTRVLLDTSGDALREGIRAGVFLVKPNLVELQELAGSQVQDDRDIARCALALVERGHAEVVVVSLGAAGVVVATAEGTEHVRAPTVPIRSKVGAGDSTVAGFVTGMVRGMSLPEAIRYGVAAGSAAVQTPGSDLCRLDDTERLFAQISRAQAV